MTQPSLNDASSMQRAREIALRTLAGDYDLLLACRDLSSLRGRLPGVSDGLMDVFLGVASEVDDLPIGAERNHWSAESLKRKDIEANDYQERVREVVTGALQGLLAALGGSSQAN
ncbi:MAG: DUF2489 domain-containing protein [Steroidobacteraceae bacterium]